MMGLGQLAQPAPTSTPSAAFSTQAWTWVSPTCSVRGVGKTALTTWKTHCTKVPNNYYRHMNLSDLGEMWESIISNITNKYRIFIVGLGQPLPGATTHIPPRFVVYLAAQGRTSHPF
jgi:hypothetical protein